MIMKRHKCYLSNKDESLMSESQNKKALKSGIWYIIGNFLLKGIGFITTPFFTRLMTQEDIGDFSNLLTWVGVLSIIFTIGLYSSISVARFDFKKELDNYISSILLLGTCVTLAFFAIVFPFREFFLSTINVPEYAFYYSFAYMITYPAIQIFQAKSQVEYKYKASLLISIGSAIGSSSFSLLLVATFKNQLYGRTVGYFIPFMVVGCGVYIYLLLKGKCISPKYWKYALTISLPLVFHLLAGYILSSSDRIMIRSLLGSKELGLYSVAYTGAMVVSVLMTSMNSAWVPWSMAQIDSNNIVELKEKARYFVILFEILVFGIVLLGPEVLLIMGGRSYMDAMDVIPPVMVGFVFQFIYSLYVNIEQYYKKQKMVAIGTVIAAIVNVVLNWFLIPVYGYVAAAYTTLVSYIILFLVHFFFVRSIKKEYIYDGKFNIIMLSLALVLLPVATLLYMVNVIRYSIVGLILAAFLWIIIKYKKEIVMAVKTKSLKPFMNIIRK